MLPKNVPWLSEDEGGRRCQEHIGKPGSDMEVAVIMGKATMVSQTLCPLPILNLNTLSPNTDCWQI